LQNRELQISNRDGNVLAVIFKLMVHFRKFCCQNLRLEMVTCEKFATSVYSFEMEIPLDLRIVQLSD
jgi:hypothetical protein